jgi:hypothetical protein
MRRLGATLPATFASYGNDNNARAGSVPPPYDSDLRPGHQSSATITTTLLTAPEGCRVLHHRCHVRMHGRGLHWRRLSCTGSRLVVAVFVASYAADSCTLACADLDDPDKHALTLFHPNMSCFGKYTELHFGRRVAGAHSGRVEFPHIFTDAAPGERQHMQDDVPVSWPPRDTDETTTIWTTRQTTIRTMRQR